jgi:UDP-glucose 4-epimerase
MTGKVRFDNDAFMIPDRKKLLAVCFCCHCCCMMRYYKYMPAAQLNEVMPRVEGFALEITEACTGCGECIEYCGWDAIRIENNRAVHSDKCRGCARCALHCPEQAVRITVHNPHAVTDVENRVLGYVQIQ